MADPNLGLHAASGLVSFLLRTTVESLVCVAVVRLTPSARWRFRVWLAMLIAFCAEWAWMWGQLARAAWPNLAANRAAVLDDTAPRRISVGHPIADSLCTALAVLAVVYAGMLVWRLLALATARVRLARAMRHARLPGERVAQAFAYVMGEAQAAGVEIDCELRVLPGIASPATIGWRHPVVIVPPLCELHSDDELAAILRHEVKHVQRRDAFWNTIAQWCCAVLWFHPAVLHAGARLRVERELACDADVIREHPQARDVYASCLLQFARVAAPESRVAAIEMASAPALLTRRVQSILAEVPKSSLGARALRTAANVGLVGLTIAATPRLNVMFAEDAGAVVLQTPARVLQVQPEPMTFSRATRRTAHAPTRAGLAPEEPALVVSAAPMVVHDDALAAEHRSGINVLTESTGMEPAAGSEVSAGAAAVPASHSGPHPGTNLWGKIAVDAAERMGPLMGDHDHDGHMR